MFSLSMGGKHSVISPCASASWSTEDSALFAVDSSQIMDGQIME